MSIIEKAVKKTQERKLVIKVPEWGEVDKPLQIHITPMTMAEMNSMQKIATKNPSNLEQAVNIIVVKAKDENGNRLFKVTDKDTLLEKVDYKILSRIATEIEEFLFGSVEAEMGNLNETTIEEAS